MNKTLPPIEWADANSDQGPATRSLASTEFLRWRESELGVNPRSTLEAAGNPSPHSIPQNTANAFNTRIPITRVKKAAPPSKTNYILLKKYNGFVSQIDSQAQTFIARLYEVGSEYPVMEAEFDLEELSEADRKLVVEGAALVWTIGYHDEESRRRESLIYMRRRPGWDTREIERAKREIEELTRGIQWK